MSIDAKLAGTPGGGHGLTADILEAIYGELVKGKQVGLVPALVLLQPAKLGLGVKKKARSVTFEVVRLEPVTDLEQADEIRQQIADAYRSRNEPEPTFDDLGEEDARRYLGYLEEWRKENKLTTKQLGEQWREQFPPGNGASIPGDPKKAGPQALLEFCLAKGVITDETGTRPSNVRPLRDGDA